MPKICNLIILRLKQRDVFHNLGHFHPAAFFACAFGLSLCFSGKLIVKTAPTWAEIDPGEIVLGWLERHREGGRDEVGTLTRRGRAWGVLMRHTPHKCPLPE